MIIIIMIMMMMLNNYNDLLDRNENKWAIKYTILKN